MTKSLTLVLMALVVVALLFFARKPDQSLDPSLLEGSDPTLVVLPEPGSPGESDEATDIASESTGAEANTQVNVSEQPEAVSRDYVPGYFDAPEHLQTGVYKAINEPRSSFTCFVENMECVSGNCNILIRVTAASGLMTKAADLMASINSQFEESSLTEGIVVGIVSVRPDENGEGLIEFVTMKKPIADGSE